VESQVLWGNCFNVLPTIRRGQVQTVFIDPPYNIGVDYGNGSKADKRRPDEYVAQMKTLANQCVQTLTRTGSLWFLCPEQWADQIGSMLTELLPRRNRIIWRETFGQYIENRFPSGHRHLFWHVMCPDQTPFYTDEIRVESQRMRDGDKRAKGPRVPDDVWELPRLVGNASERIHGHPCQLPEALLERVIRCSAAPGDMVLDPMAGTGTTLRVAQRSGRRYIGIEEQQAFVDLIEKRLHQPVQKGLF
jgi:site-specific DNA-methyltransferase (adenine-specific)